MSEETKDRMGELCDKLSQIIEKMTGVEVDKNSDKIIKATREFSVAVEEFTEKMDEVDKKYKSLVNCGIIIDVSFAGDSKIRVVGGSKKHITEVLDELREQIEK